MRIELRELRYFLQVAKAGSFSRAAESLYVAQSALSRQVKKLELELGVTLFIRHSRGIELTEAGAELRIRAEKVLGDVDDLGLNLGKAPTDTEGQISIGLPPVVGQMLGAQILAEFRKLWPRYSVQMRLAGSAGLYDWLETGQIAMALLHNSPPLDGLRLEPLLYELMHIVAPAGTEQPDHYHISSLANLPLILQSWPSNDRRLIENAAERHAIRLSPRIEIDSIQLARTSVAQGLGVTITTFSAVQDDVAAGSLCAVPIANPPLKSTLSLATCDKLRPTVATAGLKRCVHTVVQSAVRSGQWKGAILANTRAAIAQSDANSARPVSG